MPLVSIVISTFNRSGFLRASLRSALQQRGVDTEIIVVDNGSSDDTQAMLRRWSTPPSVRVLRNEQSLGATGGRNTGLAAARGDWVAILDDDDLWAPDKLRLQLEAAERDGTVWAFAGCVYVDRDGDILGGSPPPSVDRVMRSLPVRYVVPGGISNVVWRREVLDEGGLLDPRLQWTTDWDLSLRLFRVGRPAVVGMPLVAVRQHGANLSARSAEFQHELTVVAEKFADVLGGRPLVPGVNQRFVGSETLRAGRRSAAARAYLTAIRAGDTGAIARLAGVVLPLSWHGPLRRWLLSDRAWMAQARPWVREAVAAGHRPVA